MNPVTIRRLLHASSASVLLLHFVGSPELFRVVLMGCLVVAALLESLRLSRPAVGAFIAGVVPVFRAAESKRLSGATWLCAGYVMASWFPHPANTAGILVGAFADPAASWVGSTVGTPSAKKTWVGSGAAAVVAATVIYGLGLPWLVVVGGTTAAMLLERWSGRLNDNLVVAPGAALIVWLFL